jgi:hypothetical protein
MKLTTKTGDIIEVDMKTRHVQFSDGEGFPFHHMTGAFVGSTSVRFGDDTRHEIYRIRDEIVSIEGSPLEYAVAEPGNVLVLTKNSTYEIDQEQKQFRRLAGLNQVTTPDHEWVQYTQINVKVGERALFYPVNRPNDPLVTSQVREMVGTLVEPPSEHSVLAVSVAMVKAEIPRQPL